MLQAGVVSSSRFTSPQGEDHRDLAGMSGADELARQIGAVERVVEEEPQRATMLFMVGAGTPASCCSIWHWRTSGGRGVWRAPQPGREPPDVADIVALRLAREPAHGHIVDQPLTQRADRASKNKLVHRSTPQVEGAEMFCLRLAPLNPG